MTAPSQEHLNTYIVDGEVAQQLADNPFFQRLISDLDRQYVEAWRKEPDPARREKFHAMVCVVDDIKLNIQAAIDRATQAKAYVHKRDQIAAAEDRSGPLA